ncbi:MAG: hypothetical protein IKJ15_03380 [Lachnospiraceae bacterium]|nr:hypothetical protein [Lachnospiraceae bacterium]MBR3807401.1 hypothetical protein [Lachnospiraceae bacterium]MBR4059503.1 hypothetical protein [Lachnospiraceae bacterium]
MNEKNTERRHLFIKIAVTLLCFGLLAGLVVVEYISRTFNTYRVVRETEVILEEGCKTAKLANNLLIYNKDGIRCMDAKGKTIWDITYQIQEPCVSVDGGTVAVAGYGDHLIYVMDESGRIGEIDTNLPIRNLCVAEAGYVGAVLDDNEVYWIYIYDVSGEEITRARTSMEQSGYPMAIELSPNGKLLGVSYLYLDAGTVQNNVAFYNLGEVGQNYTDQYMSGYIYQEIVPELHYMNESTAMAISNGRLMVYSGSEKPTESKGILLNNTVQAVYWGDENVVLIYNGAADEGRYLMRVYDLTGTLVLEKGFDLEYTDIQSQNGVVTIYNSDEVLVVTLDGRERYKGSLGGSIRKMVSTSTKYKYLILFENTFKVIELE